MAGNSTLVLLDINEASAQFEREETDRVKLTLREGP
jgi:hypothetical protein